MIISEHQEAILSPHDVHRNAFQLLSTLYSHSRFVLFFHPFSASSCYMYHNSWTYIFCDLLHQPGRFFHRSVQSGEASSLSWRAMKRWQVDRLGRPAYTRPAKSANPGSTRGTHVYLVQCKRDKQGFFDNERKRFLAHGIFWLRTE